MIKQFLSSQAFHESLLWFRRMKKAHQDEVIRDIDLVDLWRYILPFGFAGRPNYFAEYFQGEEDIEAMLYVINETLRYCLENKLKIPTSYFEEHANREDVKILENRSGELSIILRKFYNKISN